MGSFSHLDDQGSSRMVDVGGKPETSRTAIASGIVNATPSTLDAAFSQAISKGNVVEVARLAGIMAAKRASELIPLCHPLRLDSISIDIQRVEASQAKVLATVSARGPTGVEMEALTAVSTACLTFYDMCKSLDRAMVIGPIQLEFKTGGARGDYHRAEDGNGSSAPRT